MSDRFSYTIEDAIAKFWELKNIPQSGEVLTPEQAEKLKRLRAENEFIYNALCELKEIKDNLAYSAAQLKQEHRDRVRDRRGA